MGKPKRAEIIKGVLKGTKGEIVNTNDKDRYGKSHTLKSDDGEIISPVGADEIKRI